MRFETRDALGLPWRASLERVLCCLGLDVESFLGLAARIANSGVYFITAFMTAHFLSPQGQGLFFTFMSFAALTVFVELGLSTVVIQFAAHEKSALDAGGREESLSRLQSVGRFAFAWFWTGAAMFFLLLCAGGTVFFSGSAEKAMALPWPWLLLVTGVSLDLILFPFWALLEGIRRIETVYAYRACKSLLVGLGTWLALSWGMQLLSLAVGYFAAFPLGLWVVWSNRDYFRIFTGRIGKYRVDWRKEMWPLHWRIAGSWIAGYFSVWAITPITYKLLGSGAAGRVGLTWAIAAGLSSMASAIVMVKFSYFGHLVAARRFGELDRLVLRQGIISVGLIFAGAVVVMIAAWVGRLNHLPMTQRIMSPPDVLLFMIGAVAQQATLPMAVYLRSFKREPFFWLSVISSAVLVLAVVLGCIHVGEHGAAIAYCLVMVLGVLPAGSAIFWYCRRQWVVTGSS